MAGNTESGNNRERPSLLGVVSESGASEKRRELADDAAADIVKESADKIPPVEYTESDADSWIKDSSSWDNFENISWKNGEFLKDFVNDALLVWSQDKGSIEAVKRSFRMNDFSGETAEIFISMHVDADRYYFDFNFVRADGTSKKYSLNFARRKDIVEIGGDVKVYLEQIAEKERIYATREKKPWHESGEA